MKQVMTTIVFRNLLIRFLVISMAFTPRLTADGIYPSPYWYSNGNPFYATGLYGLPNCTCYAYGRYWEITGINPTALPRGNAGTWYDNATSFPRGQVPQLGAIVCWYDPNGYYAGHVAVVEEILSNGDIITSNSGYFRPIEPYPPDTHSFFFKETCVKNNGYRSYGWMTDRGYRLKGFIYLDSEPIPSPDVPQNWVYGNRYLDTSEMENNAYLVYSYLYRQGWSYNAICALLGNMVRESTINPALYESFIVSPSSGYGLVQWTPATKYTNWANSYGYDITDGNYQLQWLIEQTVPTGQWAERYGFNLTWEEFTTSTETVDYLTEAFMWNFENPGVTALDVRLQWAHYFYDYLINLNPLNPPTTNPDERRKTGLKVWQMIRYY